MYIFIYFLLLLDLHVRIIDQAGLVESITGEAATVTQVHISAITGNIFKSSVHASAVRRTDNTFF